LCSSGAHETTQECSLRQAVTKKDDDTEKHFTQRRAPHASLGMRTVMRQEWQLSGEQVMDVAFGVDCQLSGQQLIDAAF
jgi:hypothetical protein